MIIESIELMNWGPYIGSNKLILSNTIYGVIGEHESDKGRSNWLGKTWFLSAIRYVLYGTKPDHVINEDMCITRGEKEMGIILELDEGMVISRSRKRGKSSQLTVVAVDGSESRQQTAQDIIDKYIGMNQGDFIASCFIGQKQISKLILDRPADRTKVVNNWFNLEPLQKSFEIQKEDLGKLLDNAQSLEIRKQVILGQYDDLDQQVIMKRIKGIDSQIKSCDVKIKAINDELDTLDEWIEHDVKAKEYDKIVEEGKLLAAEIKEYNFDASKSKKLKARRDEIYIKYQKARSEYVTLQGLQSGEDEFDGVCPVMQKECPAISEVNDLVRHAIDEVGVAEIKADELQATYEKVNSRLNKYDKFKSKRDRMDMLRQRVIELSDSHVYIRDHGRPDDSSKLVDEREAHVVKQHTLRSDKGSLEQKLGDHRKHKTELDDITKKLDKLNKQIAIAHEALAVFGRNGVQKTIAEGALKEIESDANLSLINAGIDLSITVTWSRIGQGLATHCESCGFSFPASRKIKECSVCHTTRGPKIVHELDIIPSDRSGAADDIAGLEFQLSAARWLRTDRGSDWSVVFIDEPFGALDKTNSRLLSNYIHSMIRNQYSFNQGFIVAHDTEITSSLPSIIKVIGSDKGSRLEVINGTK